MPSQNVKQRLDAWREAERCRDALRTGSPEWQEADEDVQSAAKIFHAELAQMYVRYAEAEVQERNPWSAQLDRRTFGARGSLATASFARWLQR